MPYAQELQTRITVAIGGLAPHFNGEDSEYFSDTTVESALKVY
jgi:hypothetical protein